MAEPANRPVPQPYPALKAAPAPALTASDGDMPGYRPLSIPAVLGFALAALYAGFLVLCWTVALVSGTPILMSAWSLLVPFAAVLVCALAWVQIQRSEGARAGKKIALWGMGVAGFFGLSYGAYFAATYAALGWQAESFANNWVEQIRAGKIDEAFRLTRPADGRPREGPELRKELELRFNGERGPLTTFRQCDPVRLLNHGRTSAEGADTVVQPLGVKSCEYRNGGYLMLIAYQVATPERTVELQVSVQGIDRGQEGREWTVTMEGGQTGIIRRISEQPLARRIQELKFQSSAFIHQWIKKVRTGDVEQAYLETLESPRRAQVRAEYNARLVAQRLAPGLMPLTGEAARQAFLPGYREFLQGKLVNDDPGTFWADKPYRNEIVQDVKGMFQQSGEGLAENAQPDSVNFPHWSRQGDQVVFAHDFRLTLAPKFAVRGAFVVGADVKTLEANDSPEWHMIRLDLYSGLSMAPPATQHGPPGL